MRKNAARWLVPHALLCALLLCVLALPNRRLTTRGCGAFVAAIAVMEGLFLLCALRSARRRAVTGAFAIISLVWALLLAWELSTAVLNVAHPVLVPAPENVFDTFHEQWALLLRNVAWSLELLLLGLAAGMTAGVVLGLAAGWFPRLRAVAQPIANVMAPIPPIVFSPYLVALMPTFRSASLLVIVLGVFWPTLLTTIGRASSVDRQIMDAARLLAPSGRTMIFSILLPYVLPGVLSGLKVTLVTSVLMLNFAELMGATHGMGYYVQNSITYANYAHALAGILVIGIVVTLLAAAAGWAQKKLVRWQ